MNGPVRRAAVGNGLWRPDPCWGAPDGAGLPLAGWLWDGRFFAVTCDADGRASLGIAAQGEESEPTWRHDLGPCQDAWASAADAVDRWALAQWDGVEQPQDWAAAGFGPVRALEAQQRWRPGPDQLAVVAALLGR